MSRVPPVVAAPGTADVRGAFGEAPPDDPLSPPRARHEHPAGVRHGDFRYRSILRLGLFEMIHSDDVPHEVAVGEAIELATGFSSDDAPGFGGGVLRGAEGRVLGGVGYG